MSSPHLLSSGSVWMVVKISHPLPPSPEPEPVFNVDVDSSGVVGGGAGPYVYASFPVDVVVYFHMQPSTIRYVCLGSCKEKFC